MSAPGSIEMLLEEQEIRPLFSRGFYPDSVDSTGYDLRLGDKITFLNRGKEMECKAETPAEILPGDVIVVTCEETLRLPSNVFAIGSPKMSLIVKGLWAHGGKTDFGFNLPFRFGFQHVGKDPITLKPGDKIFHLTFFRVNNKTTRTYSGRGPVLPTTLTPSPLEEVTKLSKELESKVEKSHGIVTARLLRLMRITVDRYTKARFLASLFGVATFAILVIGVLGTILPLQTAVIFALPVILFGILSDLLYAIAANIAGRLRKKQ